MLDHVRQQIRAQAIPTVSDDTDRDEYSAIVEKLITATDLSEADRTAISENAADFIRQVRKSSNPTMMEAFLAEYGLSTQEGVALMTLAEALLRTPDSLTIDELINDKLSIGAWERHIGQSKSAIVNSATWGLLLTGKVLTKSEERSVLSATRQMVRRLGEPVIRSAVATAMRRLGKQFVLGTTITEAFREAADDAKLGYTFSFDMLGEAARTAADADRYFDAYKTAIETIGSHAKTDDLRKNPGISVKLSALHPRYEVVNSDRVMTEMAPRVHALAKLAKELKLGFNIDAEEQDRLDLSLDIITQLLDDPDLADWDGLGIVVQAYGPRALPTIDFLLEAAEARGRRIMIRLVKGAYWDTEVKRAQTLGLKGFPVFTRKAHTDVSYLACARRLLEKRDIVYPQFATHNAHTVSAVLHMAGKADDSFEFQRLHGMGEALHEEVRKSQGIAARIYAPVGSHKDLLAYLVRRLLENGANSSFVNQIVDSTKRPEDIASCPISQLLEDGEMLSNPRIQHPLSLYQPERLNSIGFDWTDHGDQASLLAGIAAFSTKQWDCAPTVTPEGAAKGDALPIRNPANPDDTVGFVHHASPLDAEAAIKQANQGAEAWQAIAVHDRARCLEQAADAYEANAFELFSILIREAGKSVPDAINEVREAVDFLRFYAAEARKQTSVSPRGVFACISPWNFPLAIFTGQIAAALVTGNTVLAKPAEQTPLIAARAVQLLHESGIPGDALILLPGDGATVGAAITASPDVHGICFTGSTDTAQRIHRAQAHRGSPDAPLIAETGGLNAMIVDSSALPEQAVRDIVASAFQSAGQRCSALRMLYVQEDTADDLINMLKGAMDELGVGDPAQLSTDVGPVIDAEAKEALLRYCRRLEAKGKLIKKLDVPTNGHYVPPHLLKVSGIEDLDQEQFGPILHVATFKAKDFEKVIDAINAKGYGLTFGLHTRIEARVDRALAKLKVGNIYVNRNQIGAIVGSQPFGGEGLSGTGPKAGGPLYLSRFVRTLENSAEQSPLFEPPHADQTTLPAVEINRTLEELDHAPTFDGAEALQTMSSLVADEPHAAFAVNATVPWIGSMLTLPGPTGESNRWSVHPRGTILIAGTDRQNLLSQLVQALLLGNKVLTIAPFALEVAAPFEDAGWPVRALDGMIDPHDLQFVEPLDGVCWSGEREQLPDLRRALADRDGPILPLMHRAVGPERYIVERHLCVDTTAAGGNATLLAAAEV